MAQTIVAFSATPRAGGNSDILADHILGGAKEAGATVEKVKLHGLSIKPCSACGSCQKSVDEPCVQSDDMAPLLEKICAADGIVFASPIYFFTVNAQMKAFLDRMYALFGEGRFDTLKGKRAALAFAYGDPDPLASGVANALGVFQGACAFLCMELTGWVHAACVDAGDVENNRAVLDAATALGRKLAAP